MKFSGIAKNYLIRRKFGAEEKIKFGADLIWLRGKKINLALI